MNSKKLIQSFQEYLEIEQQRNLLMFEVSKLLGVDFTFSNEEMITNAEQKLEKKVMEEMEKEMAKWMK
tara:strand:+ start:597 stop:800 length:204 start_codon:yes stop_codon:yes gene_type:complete